MTAPPVGFIGIGAMGEPMAANVQRAGFPLHIYDRRRHRLRELAKAGAVPHPSAAALAAAVPITVTCVTADADVEGAVLAPEGWLSGASAGTVLIETTTATPQIMRRVAEACGAKGVEVLDAPISGSVKGAREGGLTFMVGGEPAVLERCRPVLEAMGKAIFHVGPVGAGKAMKILNQIMSGINTLAVCEAAVLAKKAGVDLAKMLEVLSKGAARSYSLETKLPQFILKGEYAPGFKTSLQIKDLGLALQMASALEVPMLLTGTAYQAYRASAGAGNADADTSAAFRWLGELAGVRLP